jgi:hypothetical protein
VRAHAFFLKRGRFFTGSLHGPLDEGVDAKAGNCPRRFKRTAVSPV